MFGIIYIILSMMMGKELAEVLLFTGKNSSLHNDGIKNKKISCNQIWILFAAAFGMGTLVFGWVTYMVSWAASAAGATRPLIYGNIVIFLLAVLILGRIYWKRYKKT